MGNGSDTGKETEVLPDLDTVFNDIRSIRRSAENLLHLGDSFPALSKNAARILASLKMIELNVPDASKLSEPDTE